MDIHLLCYANFCVIHNCILSLDHRTPLEDMTWLFGGGGQNLSRGMFFLWGYFVRVEMQISRLRDGILYCVFGWQDLPGRQDFAGGHHFTGGQGPLRTGLHRGTW